MKEKSINQQLARFRVPNGRAHRTPEVELSLSVPLSTPPAQTEPTNLTYDQDLFSGTESEMTEEEQPGFATPISSRSETPPPANANDLGRCVTIMQQIATQDVALLKELTAVREMAAKLRKRARDVRELVKAENGRRERMEAYLRYWKEVEPNWDRRWLYEEQTSNKAQRRPELSPEEVQRRRQSIISKQEDERRELEELQRRNVQVGAADPSQQ